MLRPILTALVLLGLPLAASAQTKHNSNAPIDFDAGAITLQDKQHRAILSGNVTVKQAEMTLTADRMTINYSGQVVDGSPQATRVDAAGGVTVVRPDQRARAQFGVYDLSRHVITMLGGVTLNQKGNVINGGRLVIDLDSGRANIDGSGVGGGTASSSGLPGQVTTHAGRVTGRFSVPNRSQ